MRDKLTLRNAKIRFVDSDHAEEWTPYADKLAAHEIGPHNFVILFLRMTKKEVQKWALLHNKTFELDL